MIHKNGKAIKDVSKIGTGYPIAQMLIIDEKHNEKYYTNHG